MARITVFNEEMFLEKTCEFIRSNGIESMNARDLCKFVGCSTQPLFKNFGSMDGLMHKLKDYLHDFYDNFIVKIVNKSDYLYTLSYAYVLFAINEPNIFKAIFMTELAGSRTVEQVLKSTHNLAVIDAIEIQYNLTKEQSEKLYRDVRFYAHGLACQVACNSILLNECEIKVLIANLINKLGGSLDERDVT